MCFLSCMLDLIIYNTNSVYSIRFCHHLTYVRYVTYLFSSLWYYIVGRIFMCTSLLLIISQIIIFPVILRVGLVWLYFSNIIFVYDFMYIILQLYIWRISHFPPYCSRCFVSDVCSHLWWFNYLESIWNSGRIDWDCIVQITKNVCSDCTICF